MMQVENHVEAINNAIAMLETAEPSREMDCRVWCAADGTNFDLFRKVVSNFSEWMAPYYTQSMDHSMSLIPTGWTPWRIQWGGGVRVILTNEQGATSLGVGEDVRIAICIAALNARKIELEI